MAKFTFNAANHEPEQDRDFSPLPKGEYPVVITASEEKTTKAGTGKYIAFTLEVIEGDYKGRLLWLNLNHENPSQEAVDIAMRQYASLHVACNLMATEETEELHNIPFIARVDLDKRDPTRNDIKGFKPYGTTALAPKPTAPKAPTAPKVPAAPKKPWEQ